MATKKKPARPVLEDSLKAELLTLRDVDLTLTKLKQLLAFTGKPGEKATRHFNPIATVITSVEELKRYDHPLAKMTFATPTKIETTVGRILNNLFLFSDPVLAGNLEFVNYPLSGGNIYSMCDRVDDLLKEDVLPPEKYVVFLDRLHWFSFSMASFLAYSLDMESIRPLPEVAKRKAELFEKHKKRISSNDQGVVTEIERELLDLSSSILAERDSSGMKVYASGASGSFNNNYKLTAIMRGSIARSDDIPNVDKMAISSTNLMDGIGKEELYKYNDIMVLAAFAKAVNTSDGGYTVKIFNAAFGHLESDVKDSDCGTTYTQKVKLDDNFYLRYMKKGSSLVRLDRKTLNANKGKTVEVRSPLYCKNEKLCNKCMGDLYHVLGLYKLGNLPSKIGSTLLNKNLKRFHNLTVHTKEIDVLKAYSPH